MNSINDIKHIINSFYENKLSHAFLIETNDIEQCLNDIKKVIKIINCDKEYNEKCEKCNLCYQISNETLPSLLIVRPDGLTIKKDQMIELKEKMYTKPIYSKYNTYIILESAKLNSSSSNTMLKFIEEPEDNIIGFFITDNKENIIDTIKSRCQIIIQNYDIENQIMDEQMNSLVKDYIKIIELDNIHSLLYNKNVLLEHDYTRENFINFFKLMFNIYNDIFDESGKYNKEFDYIFNQEKTKIAKKLLIINKTIDNIKKNGNINLILDSFSIEMR